MRYRTRYSMIIVAIGLVVVLVGCASVEGSTNGGDASRSEELEPVWLYVVMETTSDWTDFVMPENVEILSGLITDYSEAAQPDLDRVSLALSQPIEAAERREAVTVEASLTVGLPTDGIFEFGIMRGHLGATTVLLYEIVDYVAEPIGEYRWDGINETDESNAMWSIIDWTILPQRAGIQALPYPTSILDDITEDWVAAVRARDEATLLELHSPESVSIFAFLGNDEYLVENSRESLRAEFAEDPIPGIDYSLITYTPPICFPTRWESTPRYLIIGSYDGHPGGSDMFRFGEVDGEWKIVHHVWKLGYELRRE